MQIEPIMPHNLPLTYDLPRNSILSPSEWLTRLSNWIKKQDAVNATT